MRKVDFPPEEVDRILAADARRRRLQHDLDEMGRTAPGNPRSWAGSATRARVTPRRDARFGDKIGEGERELTEVEDESAA